MKTLMFWLGVAAAITLFLSPHWLVKVYKKVEQPPWIPEDWAPKYITYHNGVRQDGGWT
jgi:tryptophan-rich sensory protein